MAKSKGKRIVRLAAKDVLRLTAVEISPDGNVVTIGGKNGAGKSSVLNAIQMALMGKGVAKGGKPVREGAIEGLLEVDLGDIIVRRVVTDDGADKLTVSNPEGARYQSPQTLLAKLYNAVSFDPLAFSRMEMKPQVETLRKLLALDFTELDAKRAELYERRTDIGRQEKNARGALELMTWHPDAPPVAVSVETLMEELGDAEAVNSRRDILVREADLAQQKAKGAEGSVAEIEKQIKALEVKLKAALAEEKDLRTKSVKAEAAVKKAPSVDVAPIKARIARSQETNNRVRTNGQFAELTKHADKSKADYEDLTEQIDDLDEQKATALATTEFPVDGLSFDESGVTYKGIPFSQCSTAEQLRVSLAIGAALNPELRVLFVRDGSLLDPVSLAIVTKLAEENDLQVWIEDARTTDPLAIIIEDGHVKASKAAG